MLNRTRMLGVLGVLVLISQTEGVSYGAGLGRFIASVFNSTENKEIQSREAQNLEVCFSPDGGCDDKLVKFIQSAKKSIDISIFDFNLDQVAHEVLVASKRIPVRVLADRRQAHGHSSLIPTLIKGGVQVKYGKQRGIMHNKFTIIDGMKLETGSFNYTNPAATKNNENQIYIFDSPTVEKYARRFEEIWEQGVEAKLPPSDGGDSPEKEPPGSPKS